MTVAIGVGSFPLLGGFKSFVSTTSRSYRCSFGPNRKTKKSAAEKIYLSRLQALAARRKTLVSYFARHSGEQKYCVSPFALSGSANSSAMCIPQTGSLTKRLLPAAGSRPELSPAAGRAFG